MDIRVEGHDVIDCLDKLSWSNAYQAFYKPCQLCHRSGMTFESGYNDNLPCIKCNGAGKSDEISEFGKALLDFVRDKL